MQQIIARVPGVVSERFQIGPMIIGLIGCVLFGALIVFWFKEMFGGRERKLKEGEKYTYRKLPTESYELNKILDKAREEKDYETEFITVKKINKLRPKTNLWTFNELFRFYYNGLGTKKNEKKALRYLMPAYKKNYAPARYSYGSYLLDKKRYKEAAEVFRAGYLEGLGRCSFALYKMYVEGKATLPDIHPLISALERLEALFIAKEKDIPEAKEIYDSSVEQRRLFEIFYEIVNNAAPCSIKKEACTDDMLPLLYFDAFKFQYEQETNDHHLSYTYLHMAAMHGLDKAQFAYGNALHNGKRTAKNEALSIVYLQAAANQGYHMAMEELGRKYSIGEGVQKDFYMAIKWYEAAVNAGNIKSYAWLGSMWFERAGENQANHKYFSIAEEWWEKGVEAGDTSCMLLLGGIKEIENNIYEARQLYARGANHGDEECQKALEELNKKYNY